MPHSDPGPGQAILVGIEQASIVFEERLEALGVAFQAIRQLADRKALPPPVMRQNDEAAIHEVADGLEVLFNGFCASAGKHHTTARTARRSEQRGSQFRAACADEPVGLGTDGYRVVRRINQRRSFKHDGT